MGPEEGLAHKGARKSVSSRRPPAGARPPPFIASGGQMKRRKEKNPRRLPLLRKILCVRLNGLLVVVNRVLLVSVVVPLRAVVRVTTTRFGTRCVPRLLPKIVVRWLPQSPQAPAVVARDH